MVYEIALNNRLIKVDSFRDEKINGKRTITVEFKVSSKEYHEITTLLYKGTFQLDIPEQNNSFKVSIVEYSTSITNLYKEGQIGEFTISLQEVES